MRPIKVSNSGKALYRGSIFRRHAKVVDWYGGKEAYLATLTNP